MDRIARTMIGMAFGAILSFIALIIAGVGHGSYVPAAANASLVMFVPYIGGILILLAPPFLWAYYYLSIPDIKAMRNKYIALCAVILLHLIPAALLAAEDSNFMVDVNREKTAFALHALFFIGAIITLVYVSCSKYTDTNVA